MKSALKDNVSNRRKASLVRDICILLGGLGLSGPRSHALLCRRWKVYYFHLLLPTLRELSCILEPPLLLFLPLKYGKPTLLPSIGNHGLGREKQPRVHRLPNRSSLKEVVMAYP